MKNTILISCAVLIAGLSTGCSSVGSSINSIGKNLANDGAIVRFPTPWGPAIRVGGTTNIVDISAEGAIKINGVVAPIINVQNIPIE